MDTKKYFEKNLAALSKRNTELYRNLLQAKTNTGIYKFVETKTGGSIPAFIDKAGTARPLHSVIAPEREAEKIIGTVSGEAYIVILGFGAGFTTACALNNKNVKHVLLIDFNINGFAEILSSRDFVDLFNNSKLDILFDPSFLRIEQYILQTYSPCLHGGMRTIPLQSRCNFDGEYFIPASRAIKSALDNIAQDYSVQAVFGKRWFSNIIRNVYTLEKQNTVIEPVTRAAICAAGPSLDFQLDAIKKNINNFFLIATDTSLGTLLNAGIKPNAVISIDCQNISYYHFEGYNIEDIPLFLDMASPPLLTALSKKTFLFSSAHPLCSYIDTFLRNTIKIDSSGGNVTYAALSLAYSLGAKEISVFGADFSYPQGNIYTRGAYFYPYFHRRQNKLNTTESLVSSFLYKPQSLQMVSNDSNGSNWYYETSSLKMYKEKFQEKAACLNCTLIPEKGLGAKIELKNKNHATTYTVPKPFLNGKLQNSAENFLNEYRKRITALGDNAQDFLQLKKDPSNINGIVWNTLLPTAASIRYKEKINDIKALSQEVKNYCAKKIEVIVKAMHSF
ncbi:MAG: DUF115 domain-containing protein [Spirochaetaceae bacterium]|jgi:hypothetical protein|nr:DUF115 domain-containing protein [Spirochaetaceae bacterium]